MHVINKAADVVPEMTDYAISTRLTSDLSVPVV